MPLLDLNNCPATPEQPDIANRWLSAIVDSSDDAIASKDLNGIITSWNKAAERLFGYKAAEIIGKSVLLIIPPELHSDETLILDRIKAGQAVEHFHTVRLHRSGKRLEVSLTVSPVKDVDGNVIGAAKIVRDITRQRRLEVAALKLAAIVESSDDAIASKDLNGIVTSWNSAAERLFQYKAEEIIGRSIKLIIPPEFHSDEDMILSRIRKGEKIDHFETVRCNKSGDRIDVSLSISPIKDEEGKIIGAAKIARDITEKKRIEAALRTTEKLAAAGRLAATVAHEINNPLEAITNLVYLANRDLPDVTKAAAHLQLASSELDRVAHIARQTLGFYRDTSSPIAFSVTRTLDDVLFLYANRLEICQIKVTKEYQSDVVIVAFEGEIRQAISNLLTNAIDAMPTGGSLVIRVSNAREQNNSRRPGVRITFLDTGVGIPSDVRKSLFQPFFTTKKDVGTGLGLWITRNIVQKHHGTIHLKSKTGTREHGTAFSIFLPVNGTGASQPRENQLVVSGQVQ